MARFCTTKYEAPTADNLAQTFMHLTNYTLNKNSDDFKHGGAAPGEDAPVVGNAMPDFAQGDIAEDSDAGSKR